MVSGIKQIFQLFWFLESLQDGHISVGKSSQSNSYVLDCNTHKYIHTAIRVYNGKCNLKYCEPKRLSNSLVQTRFPWILPSHLPVLKCKDFLSCAQFFNRLRRFPRLHIDWCLLPWTVHRIFQFFLNGLYEFGRKGKIFSLFPYSMNKAWQLQNKSIV